MGCHLRPTDDGLVDHAINCGNNRDVVIVDDHDQHAFLHILGRSQPRYPFRLSDYCTMSNHFHLSLECRLASRAAEKGRNLN